MAFKLAKSPTFKAPVTALTPNERGGFDKETFTAEFKRVSMEDLDQYKEQNMTHYQILDLVLVGFEGLLDEDNEPVAFTEATKAALLGITSAVNGLIYAFYSTLNKAPEKN